MGLRICRNVVAVFCQPPVATSPSLDRCFVLFVSPFYICKVRTFGWNSSLIFLRLDKSALWALWKYSCSRGNNVLKILMPSLVPRAVPMIAQIERYSQRLANFWIAAVKNCAVFCFNYSFQFSWFFIFRTYKAGDFFLLFVRSVWVHVTVTCWLKWEVESQSKSYICLVSFQLFIFCGKEQRLWLWTQAVNISIYSVHYNLCSACIWYSYFWPGTREECFQNLLDLLKVSVWWRAHRKHL